MKCDRIRDYLYGIEEPDDFISRLRAAFHLFICSDCATQAKTLEHAAELDFLPPASNTADLVMAIIGEEETQPPEESTSFIFSLRDWALAGLGTLCIGSHLQELRKRFGL